MAIHRATGGSEDGYKLFRAWSETSPYYNEAECRTRWDAITGCPATWIGARFLRRMAIAHGWTPPPPPEPPDPDTVPGQRRLDEPAELPLIVCAAGQLPRMVVEAEAALLAANVAIYQRGVLVRPAEVEYPASHGRKTH